MNKTSKLKKFARTLLAGSCLTAAAAVAEGGTIVNESIDFPNSSPGTNLGSGVSQVNGSLGGADSHDYFYLTGLTPGFLALIGFSASIGSGPAAIVFNSSNSTLGYLLPGGSRHFNVPGDGILRIGSIAEGNDPYRYSVTISDPSTTGSAVPEPATLALTAGAMAAVALGRRRKK